MFICSIAPPDLLAELAEEGEAEQRRAAVRALSASASARTQRTITMSLLRQRAIEFRALPFALAPTGEQRTVYDVQNGGRGQLPGRRVRGEDDPPVVDDAVNEAYDNSGITYRFFLDVFDRNSIDDAGSELISSVHYGVQFDNALWNGVQMIYGDGSGRIFREGSFTRTLDIVAHELTHGIIQFTAGLEYSKQSGALNESYADVFGSLTKQWNNNETAEEADWLLGEGVFVAGLGNALRSLKAPGTAWRRDRQPATMSNYQDLPDDNDPRNDNGGVHINSGIPNHAFYRFATALGGNAWDRAGQVWYRALVGHLQPDSQFKDAADATVQAAQELFGDGEELQAVRDAWTAVEVL